VSGTPDYAAPRDVSGSRTIFPAPTNPLAQDGPATLPPRMCTSGIMSAPCHQPLALGRLFCVPLIPCLDVCLLSDTCGKTERVSDVEPPVVHRGFVLLTDALRYRCGNRTLNVSLQHSSWRRAARQCSVEVLGANLGSIDGSHHGHPTHAIVRRNDTHVVFRLSKQRHDGVAVTRFDCHEVHAMQNA